MTIPALALLARGDEAAAYPRWRHRTNDHRRGGWRFCTIPAAAWSASRRNRYERISGTTQMAPAAATVTFSTIVRPEVLDIGHLLFQGGDESRTELIGGEDFVICSLNRSSA
ncbi:hypothetical protein BLTE_03710 [Blastochloris tepida]|uniref:Uncharacterized protein n=1 Tax=Blastochloris tepida TaxID=2233851 RepID=A0A348FWK3_9HYPH|nr:hypothetical protein BLTE_03710 [Blastochloris tepida]